MNSLVLSVCAHWERPPDVCRFVVFAVLFLVFVIQVAFNRGLNMIFFLCVCFCVCSYFSTYYDTGVQEKSSRSVNGYKMVP